MKKCTKKCSCLVAVMLVAALLIGGAAGWLLAHRAEDTGNYSDEMKMDYRTDYADFGANAVERKGDHENSPYYFIRTNCPPSDTLTHDGKGAPVAYTGMTWSGFRPSDDACQYGYLIPSNMMAVVALRHAAEMVLAGYQDEALAEKLTALLKG